MFSFPQGANAGGVVPRDVTSAFVPEAREEPEHAVCQVLLRSVPGAVVFSIFEKDFFFQSLNNDFFFSIFEKRFFFSNYEKRFFFQS